MSKGAMAEEDQVTEAEFSNEEDGTLSEQDIRSFSQAVLWASDWTVETILSQLGRGNIEMNPRFQRRDAWNKPAKSRFVESLILGLPIPQIVLAERRDRRGQYIVLDGKQRLLTLLQFSGNAQGDNNLFRLSGLEARPDLRRRNFNNLRDNPELQDDFNAFQSHTIRAVIIRNWPSLAFLHLVFLRLNTGSLKLSPQELRQAIVPGEFSNFVDDCAAESQELQRLLGRNSPDPRMRDVELLVRYLSFQTQIESYAGRMKEFLDESSLALNEQWGHREQQLRELFLGFTESIRILEEIFGPDNVARKQGSRLFNRSIFDALSFYMGDPQLRLRMRERAEPVRQAYADLVADQEFQIAVESDTAGIPHTLSRLRLWGERLRNALDQRIAVPELRENRIAIPG
jgi:hypothetical protein